MSWLFNSLLAKDREYRSLSSSSSECLCITADNLSVKDDHSAIGGTLGRRLRGFISFLAPPPSSVVAVDSSAASSSCLSSSSQALLGVRNDLAEISGSLKTGLSLLAVTSNKALGKISRIATNFLPFQRHSDDDEKKEAFKIESVDGVPGITAEVLKFVTDITSQTEYWTDIPLPLDDTDFKMCDIHRIHISTVEQLIPNISTLKLKLQSFMSEEQFWLIYFVILLPRLNGHDFEVLLAPEIVEAREKLRESLESEENVQVNSEPTNKLVANTLDENMPFEDDLKSKENVEVNSKPCSNKLVADTPNENVSSDEETNSTQVISDERSPSYNRESSSPGLKKADMEILTDAKDKNVLGEISFNDIDDDRNDLSSKNFVTKPPSTSSSNKSEYGDWVQLHLNFEESGWWLV